MEYYVVVGRMGVGLVGGEWSWMAGRWEEVVGWSGMEWWAGGHYVRWVAWCEEWVGKR